MKAIAKRFDVQGADIVAANKGNLHMDQQNYTQQAYLIMVWCPQLLTFVIINMHERASIVALAVRTVRKVKMCHHLHPQRLPCSLRDRCLH